MIHYVQGDATRPTQEGQRPVLLVHGCNNKGKWGSGFVLAVSRRWPGVKNEYLIWAEDGLNLGEVQYIQVETAVKWKKFPFWVGNMITQTLYEDFPPVKLDAVEKCLTDAAIFAAENEACIVMPRICCGLGGEKWANIEPIIEKTCEGIDVFVYDI